MDECDLVKAMELAIQQLQDVIEIAPGMCRILLNRYEGLLIFVSSRSREHFRQMRKSVGGRSQEVSDDRPP